MTSSPSDRAGAAGGEGDSRPSPDADTTRLLNRFAQGEHGVQPRLLEAIYGELHQLALASMRGQSPGHTLQATALVNEAWIRIERQDSLSFEGRSQFYALASRVMRSVLVDHSRAARREKRGGGQAPLSLSSEDLLAAGGASTALDVLALEEAMERLEAVDPELCRLVELRFFGGLTHEEIAELEGVSVRTVERRWRAARAFLLLELGDGES